MSKTFCPLPWLFLAIRNNGTLRVCCQSNISESRGIIRDSNNIPLNARDADLDLSRNETIMKQTRLDMMDGKWPEPCIRCKSEEESGLNSRRNYESSNWDITLEEAKSATATDGSIDTKKLPLKYFDIRFGNRCNLACRMCGPTDSDSWYNDHVKLTQRNWFNDTEGKVVLSETNFGKWKDRDNSYQWYDLDHFWQQLDRISPQLVHIYLAGGEPLLIDEHYHFLERCIEKGYAKNIKLEYNTNLTILPARALDLWKLFKCVNLGLSIDGSEKITEYQRYPSKWINIEHNLVNLNRYLDSHPNINAWLACTVTIYNAFDIPRFVEWKLKSGLHNINRQTRKPIITHHMAHKPHHLNVRTLPDHLKRQLAIDYENSLKTIREHYNEKIVEAAKRIYDGIHHYATSQSYYSDYWEDFVRYTEDLDSIRGQKHHDYLYESLSGEISLMRTLQETT